jgi:hypothetical protein
MPLPSPKVSRRRFLKSSAAALAAPAFVPARVFSAPGRPGANERVILGVIGVHLRGPHLIKHMPAAGQVVAISDCYTKRMEETLAKFDRPGWSAYQDYREMLDSENLDAVVVSCRALQRVLICIHACQAGVDIYAEKPLSLYVREGRPLIEAVKKYNIIFQHGTQSRTLKINRYVADLIQQGRLGRLRRVLLVNQEGPIAVPRLPEQPIPEGLDWDAWTNQAPLLPYHETLYTSFSKFRCYDGGQVTNWVHALDMVQFALDKSHTGPVELWPEANYQGEPHRRPVHLRYADGTLVSYELPKKGGPDGGAVFAGEDAKLEVNFNKMVTNPPDFFPDAPAPEELADNTITHLANWLECVKSRQTPNADVETAHRSTSVSHLINICRWSGRKLRWDPRREIFLNDAAANAWLDRPRREGYELPDPV